MYGSHMQIAGGRRAEHCQVRLGPAVSWLPCQIGANGCLHAVEENRDSKPTLQSRIERSALRRADIPRLAGPGKRTEALRFAEVISGMIELEYFLVASPRGQIFHVPAQFIRVDEFSGRGHSADGPLEKLINDAAAQTTRRFPIRQTWIGQFQRPLVLVWNKPRDFGRGLPEVEGDHRGNPFIECSGYGGRITTTSYGPEQDDPFVVDVFALEQKIHAAHDVPNHPFDEAFAHRVQLHPGDIARMIEFAFPGITFQALAIADLIYH